MVKESIEQFVVFGTSIPNKVRTVSNETWVVGVQVLSTRNVSLSVKQRIVYGIYAHSEEHRKIERMKGKFLMVENLGLHCYDFSFWRIKNQIVKCFCDRAELRGCKEDFLEPTSAESCPFRLPVNGFSHTARCVHVR